MGVRLAALAFERSEALVISATLDAAGVPNWVYWYNMIWNDPAQCLVYDGFQIVVVEEDLEDAIAVLREARAHPSPGCEVLVARAGFIDRALSFFLPFFFFGGAPFPLRRTYWQPAPQDGHKA